MKGRKDKEKKEEKEKAASAKSEPSYTSNQETKATLDRTPSTTLTHLESEVMPDAELVERMFEEAVEDMALQPAVIEAMKAFDVNRKWLIVQQNRKEQAKENPVTWAEELAGEGYRLASTYVKLRPVINSSNKKWIEEFVRAGGLKFLMQAGRNLHFKDNDSGNVLIPCLGCLTAFMNNRIGIEFMLQDEEVIKDMTLWFDNPNIQVKSAIMKLLSVLIILQQQSKNIIDAFANLQEQNEGRLASVVRFLMIKDVECRKTALVFINTSINFAESLEERVALRKEYTDLGIVPIIQEVREWASQRKGVDFKRIVGQCDMFESFMADDVRETMYHQLDMSDPVAIYKYLKLICKDFGTVTQLLHILHMLLLIPKDVLGEEVWSTVMEIVHLAITAKKETNGIDEKKLPDEPVYMSYEELKDRVGQVPDLKEKYAKMIDTLKEQVESMKKQSHQSRLKGEHAQDQANQAQRVIADLKSRIEDMKKNPENYIPVIHAPSVPVPSTTGAAPPPPPPPPGGSAGPPPPPPPPPPPGPGVPPPPPAPGVPGAPPPPPAPGVPGAPPPPPVPGGPGAPPPPPAPGGRVAPVVREDPPPPGMKSKAPVKFKTNGVKMKQFHWGKIPNKNIEGTVWQSLSDERVEIPADEIENLFRQQETKKKEKVEEKEDKKKKSEVVKLIDDKRSYNIDLSMARFKIQPEVIRDAILAMDEQLLNLERLPQIIKCAPTQEECETVKNYDGDPNLLGGTEKFFLALSDISNLTVKLDLWQYKLTFDDTYRDLKNKLDLVANATLEIRTSKRFRQVLEVILAIGNVLNTGTKVGSAYGFKLSALKQLNGTKTADNKSSLLEYIIIFCEQKNKTIRQWVDDFKDVPDAMKVESKPFIAEVEKFANTMNKVKGAIAPSPEDSKIDRFKPVMTRFYESANPKVEQLLKDVREAETDCDKLAVSFGEPAGQTAWETFFQIFKEFMDLWTDGETNIQKVRDAALKEAKRKEAEEKKKQVQESQKSKEDKAKGGGGVADQLFDELVSADPKAVMEQIKNRRQGKGAKPKLGNRPSAKADQ